MKTSSLRWTPSRALCTSGVLLVVAACTSPNSSGEALLERLELSPSTATLTRQNETLQLDATGRSASGAIVSAGTIQWSSDAPAVVTVASDGLVTAVGDGAAHVTATSGTISAVATITVERTLASLTLTPPEVTFNTLSRTAALVVTAQDAGGAAMPPGSVIWTSANAAVATVAAGVVSPVGDGTTEVTVARGGVSATAVVTVQRTLAAIEITPGGFTFPAVGQTSQLIAIGRDPDGAAMPAGPLVWASSAPGVATVSASGLLTSVGQGVTQISATGGGHSASVTVTVDTRAATIEISGGVSPFKGIDGEMQLSATARNAAGQMVNVPISWQSSDPAVASVTSTGLVETHRQGTAVIQASGDGKSGSWPLTIQTVYHVPVDPFLATPIANAAWEVPVVLLWYLPTRDGVNLDVLKSPDFWWPNPKTLAQIESELMTITRHRKMMVEQGSRFHGYADPSARPSLGYRVVEHIIIYDIPPASTRQSPEGAYFPDYHAIFAELGLSQLINAQGVREVWVGASGFDMGTPSYDPATQRAEDMRVDFESNMSSPTTGDISNSYRWADDLPVLDHTYIVYGINFRRSQAEAVHNVGHQLEAMLSHAAWLQTGSTALFWHQFVGQDAANQFITGRAGWTHMPPNTTENYDYLNPAVVASDIANWRPTGGATQPVSVDTWGGLVLTWPGGPPIGQQIESQWYVYWMQNMPGAGNQIPFGGQWMTNWWAFVADWDAAIQSGLGLYGPAPAAITGEAAPGVRVRSAAGSATEGASGRWPIPESRRR